jgi:hypothetical protein
MRRIIGGLVLLAGAIQCGGCFGPTDHSDDPDVREQGFIGKRFETLVPVYLVASVGDYEGDQLWPDRSDTRISDRFPDRLPEGRHVIAILPPGTCFRIASLQYVEGFEQIYVTYAVLESEPYRGHRVCVSRFFGGDKDFWGDALLIVPLRVPPDAANGQSYGKR